jgi:hypothetical protein
MTSTIIPTVFGADTPTLEWGTVGWADGSHHDLGDGSDTDTGPTLVHVTLFRGRDPTQPLDSTRAQGWPVLAQMASSDFAIPPLNAVVLLAVIEPFPGLATILQVRDPRASQIFGQQKPGERAITALGSKARAIFKNNDSCTLYTEDANGKAVSAYVGPDKIQLSNASGSLSLDHNGLTLTVGQAGLTLTPAGVATLSGTQVSVAGSLVAVAGSVATCLGPGAIPTPGIVGAQFGATGVPGAASTKVFIGP